MTTLEHARAYLAAGWSLIPVGLDGSKQPAFAALPHEWDEAAGRGKATWKPFQTRPPSEGDLVHWFGGERPRGVALVYGAVSGGAELIDFDDPSLFDPWLSLVRAELGDDVAGSLTVVRTPGGRHVVYRCAAPAGNLTLARRAAGEPGDAKLIETRGEGGYALAPGSPAECHPSGGAYEHAAGRPLTGPALVTDAERHVMLTLARSFNRRLDAGQARSAHAPDGADGRPGSDFDRRATLREVLEPAGWVLALGAWDHGHLRRPGKDRGVSASVGHARGGDGVPLLWVFTTSTPFEAGAWYGPFRAYAALHHGGDLSAAARALAGRGYGAPSGRAGTNGHAPHPGVPAEPGPGPWADPIPLEDSFEVAAFPLDSLPPALARYAARAAGAIGCPADYVGCGLLATAAGAAGAALALEVKPGYVESGSLYVAIVGPPGRGKTPALKAACRPLFAEQSRRHHAGDGDLLHVGDVTAEKLAELLMRNRRGLLMVRDELSAWVAGLDQYKAAGRGADRQFYVSAWAGEPVSVHRKNQQDGPVYVPHPCLTVLGGIQPDLLPRLHGDADDGFTDRLLFCCPPPLPARAEDWASVSDADGREWGRVLSALWAQAMVRGDAGERPFFLRLDQGGRSAWEDWTARLAADLNDPDFPAHLAGPWTKLKGYAARLALVVHALRCAAAGEDPTRHPVNGESMTRGCQLAAYFASHARKAHGLIGRDKRIEAAQRVLRWVAGWDRESFRRSDAWCGLRHSGFNKPEDLFDPLKLLVQTNWLRYAAQAPPPSDRRRITTPIYEINPLRSSLRTSPINPINQADWRLIGLIGLVRKDERESEGEDDCQAGSGDVPNEIPD